MSWTALLCCPVLIFSETFAFFEIRKLCFVHFLFSTLLSFYLKELLKNVHFWCNLAFRWSAEKNCHSCPLHDSINVVTWMWPDVKGAYVIGSLVWKHSSISSQLCAVWYNLPLSLVSSDKQHWQGIGWSAVLGFTVFYGTLILLMVNRSVSCDWRSRPWDLNSRVLQCWAFLRMCWALQDMLQYQDTGEQRLAP